MGALGRLLRAFGNSFNFKLKGRKLAQCKSNVVQICSVHGCQQQETKTVLQKPTACNSIAPIVACPASREHMLGSRSSPHRHRVARLSSARRCFLKLLPRLDGFKERYWQNTFVPIRGNPANWGSAHRFAARQKKSTKAKR